MTRVASAAAEPPLPLPPPAAGTSTRSPSRPPPCWRRAPPAPPSSSCSSPASRPAPRSRPTPAPVGACSGAGLLQACVLLAGSAADHLSASALRRAVGKTVDNGRFAIISLGQGQEEPAEALLDRYMRQGGWLFLDNLHLMAPWIPRLERKLEAAGEGAHPVRGPWACRLPVGAQAMSSCNRALAHCVPACMPACPPAVPAGLPRLFLGGAHQRRAARQNHPRVPPAGGLRRLALRVRSSRDAAC